MEVPPEPKCLLDYFHLMAVTIAAGRLERLRVLPCSLDNNLTIGQRSL